jgi:hypothetical protein
MTQQLFDLPPMVRSKDHETSVAAAESIVGKITKLHAKVLSAFAEHGEMTDAKLEQLPQFSDYGPSTIRKRRSELFLMGKLADTGRRELNERGAKMIVWAINQ